MPRPRLIDNSPKSRSVLGVLTAAFLVAGCADSAAPNVDSVSAEEAAIGALPESLPQPSAASGQAADIARRSVVRRGTGQFISPRVGSAPSRGPLATVRSDGAISLNLVDAGIPDAAQAVLGEALRLNYTVEAGVEGRITLQSSTPLTREALLEAFQTALEFNGATLSESGSLVTILPIGRASPRFVRAGDQRGFGRRIVVVPLRFVSPREMLRLLEPIVSSDAILSVSEARNLLMVSGNRSEIDAVLDAVNLFDIDILRGKSVALLTLTAASPEAIATELTLIFEAGEGGALEDVVRFVPNERLGSILVISAQQRYIDEARDWVRQLDATAGRTRRFSRVYPLQNRDARGLQVTLETLINEDREQVEIAEGEETGDFFAVEGKPSIVADEATNAIVVSGTESEHADISALIIQLDSTPAQVLLEATIAEVQLDDELEFGVRWFFESGNFSLSFTDLASGGVGPAFPGFSFLFDGGDGAAVALNALASVTDVQVVSSPSVLVLDNREAELRVGDQVPIATQSAVDPTDPDDSIVNNIEFRDTGVILRVRPRVSDAGRIIMDIEQEVSDVIPTTTSGIDSPTIQQRIVKTSVLVDSGQTLALGGLVQDSDSATRTKVPLLGDIPILGAAFRNTDTEAERSELLILITPRVVRDAGEGRAITAEFRRRLSSPDRLLDAVPRAGESRRPIHQVQQIFR